MTSPIPMSREELIELAALDAFGLLDGYEAALYTRSFHHAPAAVQDEVIRLQADLAVCDVDGSAEDPPQELRARVLEVVAAAIERETRGLGPIASIGRTRGTAQRTVIGRIGGGRSSLVWRAAAFVMLVATVVLGYYWTEAQRNATEIARFAIGLDTEKTLSELVGPTFEEFALNPNSVPVFMQPVTAGDRAFGVLYVNVATEEAFLVAFGLPGTDGSGTLQIASSDGTLETLGTLTRTGFCSVLRFDAPLTSGLLTATLQITVDGQTILTNA